MSVPVVLEVCVDSVESAVASAQGGAQRVELCSDLAQGGVTPSGGLIAMTRKRVAIGLQVLIRPRAGDFGYTADEFEVMKRDILLAKQLGANGVSSGFSTRMRTSIGRGVHNCRPWHVHWRSPFIAPSTWCAILRPPWKMSSRPAPTAS